jgi:hypothetical protein
LEGFALVVFVGLDVVVHVGIKVDDFDGEAEGNLIVEDKIVGRIDCE